MSASVSSVNNTSAANSTANSSTSTTGNLGSNQVTKLNTNDPKPSNSNRILAVALIIIGVLFVIAGTLLGLGLMAKGTSLVRFTPYIIVGITLMGTKGSAVAIISSIVFGTLGIGGGALLWNHIRVTYINQINSTGSGAQSSGKSSTHSSSYTPNKTNSIDDPANRIRNIVQGCKSTQIYDNKSIDKFPKFMSGTHNIKFLYIRNNTLSSIPKSTELPHLETLNLSNNELTSTDNIENFKDLVALDITKNPKLKEIPIEITQLKKLKYIYIDADKKSLLPKEILDPKSGVTVLTT